VAGSTGGVYIVAKAGAHCLRFTPVEVYKRAADTCVWRTLVRSTPSGSKRIHHMQSHVTFICGRWKPVISTARTAGSAKAQCTVLPVQHCRYRLSGRAYVVDNAGMHCPARLQAGEEADEARAVGEGRQRRHALKVLRQRDDLPKGVNASHSGPILALVTLSHQFCDFGTGHSQPFLPVYAVNATLFAGVPSAPPARRPRPSCPRAVRSATTSSGRASPRGPLTCGTSRTAPAERPSVAFAQWRPTIVAASRLIRCGKTRDGYRCLLRPDRVLHDELPVAGYLEVLPTRAHHVAGGTVGPEPLGHMLA
jgi:hypothetical protein